MRPLVMLPARLASVALLVVLTPLTLGAAPVDRPPDLSGTWKLVPERSDDPRREFEPRREAPGGEARRRASGRPTATAETGAFDQLEIAHREPQVEVTYVDGRRRTLYTDGRDLGDEEQGTMRVGSGRWEEGKLTVARENERGSIVETWELSAEGELVVTTEMQSSGRHPSRRLLRVYARD